MLHAPKPATGQEKQGTLKGKLQDEKGKPIADAEVTITNTRDRSVKTTKTNGSGDYSFQTQADEYTVGFRAEGYEEGTLQSMQQVEEGKETTVRTVRLPKLTHSSLIRGAVFDVNGRSISGVHVKLVRVPLEGEEKDPKEAKHFKSISRDYISNTRGEFAFRLPSEHSRYKLTAGAPGYRDDTKMVDVNEDESVPVSLTLLPVKHEN
ncbi:MAG TPA: carboxypeptidase-like regulatory domain-containing protein [Blastocatellia bacterium]|nr:carboxypeptidase-like regulatory domain-containing protein [Blastocatellia bacterium]